MLRKRAIWITIFAIMLFEQWIGRLDQGGFVVLIIIGIGLSKLFGQEAEAPSATKDDEAAEEESDDEDVIRIRRRSIELLRNSLMRHHNSHGTDRSYQVSKMATETTFILQELNSALNKKNRHVSAG